MLSKYPPPHSYKVASFEHLIINDIEFLHQKNLLNTKDLRQVIIGIVVLQPCGVDYELKTYVAENPDEKPHKRFVSYFQG